MSERTSLDGVATILAALGLAYVILEGALFLFA